MKRHMLLWCIVLASVLHSVYGTATTTLNCPGPGFLGQPYNITCDTTGTISSGIFWNGPGDKSVAGCNLSGECKPNTGYKTSVNANQYTLHIESLKANDAGIWKCTDGASESKTGECSLKLSSQPSTTSTTSTTRTTSTASTASKAGEAGKADTPGVNGTVPFTANKVCVGLFLATVRLILYGR